MQNEILDRPFDTPEEPEYLDLADSGKRFINYLIDRILSQVLAAVMAGGLEAMFAEEGEVNGGLDILSFLLIYATIFGYYTIMEGAFNGKTLGKFITKTRAVTIEGEQLNWNKAALRSVCRLIPFEPFSFLADKGWHDSISKTCVINDR
ncbi:MAG: RDD family protein [Saprospiraceae bacterium]|nr:RDD family protein [Saprospiraceae bacterium]